MSEADTAKKAALSVAVGAAGAGIGLLLTTRPKRLPALVEGLKDRVDSLGSSLADAQPNSNVQAAKRRADELADRRQERRAGRERRRQHATT